MILRKIFRFFKKLNELEKKTLILLFFAQSFNGLCLGILLLQEVILRKTLSGTPLQITLLTMVNPVANIFIVYVMDFFSIIRRRNLVFLLLGVFGKLILVSMMFVDSSVPFLTVLILYSVLNVLLSPFLTGIMQRNLRKMNRGVIYGLTGSASTIFSLVASVAAGALLDFNQAYFKSLFAFAGVMGFLCCYFYSKIQVLDGDSHYRPSGKKISILKPLKQSLKLLKNDRDFMLFETFFFIYGMGFMIILPSIPIYFVDMLELDYSQISMAKGFIGQLGLILFLPLMGFISDRINPMLFSAGSFFLLSFYPLLLFFSGFSLNPMLFVYLAFGVYSVSMAGVSALWDLSAIFFAGERDSKSYQVVHIFLTGIRGIIMPTAGFFLMRVSGVIPVFFVSFILYIIASLSMLLLYFSYRKRRASLPLQ